jgi:hypothetical protein
MRKNLKLWSGYLGFMFLLAGCASAVHVEKDKQTDFTNYKTFAWIDDNNSGEEKKDRQTNDLTERRIKEAISQELTKAAGWREVKNRPDVLLSYDVLVEKSLKESSNPVYSRPFTRMVFNPYTRRWTTIYYPSQFVGYETDQQEVKEGTITITMIDARTDKTVWQGWTTDEVNSRNLTSKEIQSSVRSIFKKLDIAKN